MTIRPAGVADIATFETPGLVGSDLDKMFGPRHLRKPGTIDPWLDSMEPVQKIRSNNLIFNGFAAMMFSRLFNGGNTVDPYDLTAGGGNDASYFSFVITVTTTSEPAYNTESNIFAWPYDSTDNIGGTASNSARGVKFFDYGEVEDFLISEASDGREAISYRARFLYLPSEAVSNNLNSLAIWFRADGNAGGASSNGIAGRVRFKDSGGSPITINKTSNQTLFMQYTFTLVSV
jgi:hypothetical protein